MKVTYFQLWARGPSIVLALEHAGVDYEAAGQLEGAEADDAVGRFATNVRSPAGRELTLGHELAILAYIERKCPAVAGADEREWAVSQQFVHQAEDVYKALVAKQPTLYETDKVSKEALAEWWAGDDRTLHNRKQGLQVHRRGWKPRSRRRRTKAGHTAISTRGRRWRRAKMAALRVELGKSVGECKLWATLHMLVMIKSDVPAPFPALTAFYERFGGEEATVDGRCSAARFVGAAGGRARRRGLGGTVRSTRSRRVRVSPAWARDAPRPSGAPRA